MSKEFDDINKSKNQDSMLKEINTIKKDIKDISFKVDMMLEILNNFTIMLTEEDEYSDDEDEEDESWIPEQQEDWNSYEDDEDI